MKSGLKKTFTKANDLIPGNLTLFSHVHDQNSGSGVSEVVFLLKKWLPISGYQCTNKKLHFKSGQFCNPQDFRGWRRRRERRGGRRAGGKIIK